MRARVNRVSGRARVNVTARARVNRVSGRAHTMPHKQGGGPVAPPGFEFVTVNGVTVTVNGQPVYVAVP